MLWCRGITATRGFRDYRVICSRFDMGCSAFFVLLVIKAFLAVKGGVYMPEASSLPLLIAFFAFSLLGIGLTRNQSDATKGFLAGHRKTGVALSFVTAVLLGAGGLVLFFLPHLSRVAERGYRVLEWAAEPAERILVAVVRFVLLGQHGRQGGSGPAQPGGGVTNVDPGVGNWGMELIGDIIGWGAVTLLGIATLVVILIGAAYLVRWLLSRTSGGRHDIRLSDMVRRWVVWSSTTVRLLLRRIGEGFRGRTRASQLYTAMIRWGHHSGVPHRPSDTPRDYGCRLQDYFPALTDEITTIVETFNAAVYGEIEPEHGTLTSARSALRTMCSPLHWPARLRCWFCYTENVGIGQDQAPTR
jgi:hypothetical protein